VISNVQATAISTSGVTITWTTSAAASSRVVLWPNQHLWTVYANYFDSGDLAFGNSKWPRGRALPITLPSC
jgi:hypothetical protein